MAVDYALGWGLDAIRGRVSTLAEELHERLSAIPGVSVHDQGEQRCAIVTFTKKGIPAADVSHRLREAGVNTSVTSAESARFDFEARGLTEIARLAALLQHRRRT